MRTLLSDIALKVYSREPCERKKILQALSSALKSTAPATNLRSTLAQASNVTFSIWTLSKAIHDVYFQVFERLQLKRNLRAVRRSGEANSWSLSCQLHRQHGADGQPSKTWLELDIPEFYLNRHCKVRENSAGVYRLNLRVGFHLIPGVLDSEARSTSLAANVLADQPDSTFQAFVDNIQKEQLSAIRGQIFADVNEMVATVKDVVLAYLISSPLASLVEFHYLQVIAISLKSERLVASTLLHADGSPRTLSIYPGIAPNSYMPSNAHISLLQRASNNMLDDRLAQDEKRSIAYRGKWEPGRALEVRSDTFHSL